jgi:hypothetical protein
MSINLGSAASAPEKNKENTILLNQGNTGGTEV